MSVFCQCGFYSPSLGQCVSVNVIFPETATSHIGVEGICSERRKFPVLYLLHGLSDDHSIWCRHTSVELYASKYECIIVMPAGGRSFYRNMASGAKYKDFITVDLPDFIEKTFQAETDCSNRFICGLSMGGYGALAIGLEYPDRYSKIAAFSSVADIADFADNRCNKVERLSIFGDKKLAGSDDDIFCLAEKVIDSPNRPEIFLACGTEDFLYDANSRLRRHLDNIKYPYTYIETPGVHNWYFWDAQIQNALKFFCCGFPLPTPDKIS